MFRHFVLLLWKTWLLKVRRPVVSCCEFTCPLILVLGVALLYGASEVTKVKTADFVGDLQAVPPLGSLPFYLSATGQSLALVSEDKSTGKKIRDEFQEHLISLFPGWDGATIGGQGFATDSFRETVMPPISDLIRTFNSFGELSSYVRSADYDTETKPPVFGAVIFSSNGGPEWNYTLRLNLTDAPATFSNVDPLQRTASPSAVSSYLSSVKEFKRPRTGLSPTKTTAIVPTFLPLQLAIDRFILRKAATLNPATSTSTDVATAPLDSLAPPDPLELQARIGALFAGMGLGGKAKEEFAAWTINPALAYNLSSALLNNTLRAEYLTPNTAQFFPFPQSGFSSNSFYAVIDFALPLLFVIAVGIPYLTLLSGLVAEKELKIREGLKSFGMGEFPLLFSSYIAYVIELALISLVVTVMAALTFISHSSFLLVFLFFLLYSTSSISFAFLMSTFFTRAKTAALIGFLLYLALWFPYTSVSNEGITETSKNWACLANPTAFSLGLVTMTNYENQGVGVNFDNAGNIVNDFRFTTALAMMAVDTLLYLILAWYIDNVMPDAYRGFGIARPWYFFVTRSYWAEVFGIPDRSGHHTVASNPMLTEETRPEFIQELTPEEEALIEQERCVSVRGLRKEFGDFVAVKGFSADMVEGQIFSLLGHNGAGKTTTISMLMGLLSSTSGEATMFGHELHGELSDIRHLMGVCPQHDVLWSELTVKEHLQLFGGVKNVPAAELNKEIEEGLRDVGLTEKLNSRAGSLSGGQKRKLSLLIAMLGGSKIVLLDEPTTGIDPYSRRAVHRYLQKSRRGRVILLTTHFLEEADLLSDRVAIMSNGVVKCSGSPLFLKEKFGVGYQLTAEKRLRAGAADRSPECDVPAVMAAVHDAVPDAQLMANVGTELSFRLPISSSSHFPALFHQLDEDIAKPLSEQRFRINSYGVGVTTMESVFLKIAEGDAHEDVQDAKTGGASGSGSGGEGAGASTSAAASSSASVSPSSTDGISASGGSGSGASYGTVERAGEVSIESVRGQGRTEGQVFVRHFIALLWKRFHVYKRDARAFCCQILLPTVVVALGLGLLRSGQITSFPYREFSTGDFNVIPEGNGATLVNRVPVTKFWSGVSSDSRANAPLISDVLGDIGNATLVRLNNHDLPKSGQFIHANKTTSPVTWDAQRISNYLLKTQSKYEASVYTSFFFPRALFPTANGTSDFPLSTTFEYGAAVNTTARHGVPIAANMMHRALLKQIHGKGSITTASMPLPFTARQTVLIGSIVSFFASLIILIGFSFIPTSYAVFLVKERESNAKHQQLISGVSIYAYWTSSLVWDFVSYQIPCWVTLGVFEAFNVADFTSTDDDRLTATILLLFFYGLSTSTFTYILTYFFKSHTNAQIAVLIFNFLAMVMMIASFTMDRFPSTCKTNATLKYIYMIIPGFSLGNGLSSISFLQLLPTFAASCEDKAVDDIDLDDYDSALDWKVAGTNILYLAVSPVIFFIITIAIDLFLSHPELLRTFSRDPTSLPPPPKRAVDEDVAAEEERVRAMDPTQDKDVVVLDQLRKCYAGGKHAVRGLSLGIPVGSVFGLLGVNGAGKTTTLKILSGDEIPTAGGARIAGYDVLREQAKCRRLLGYTPQFDALLGLMTVREHLELFARIKSVPEPEVDGLVREKMAQLGLEQYEHKRADQLSGGNRRKLSVAISLIGEPPLVILDECTSGVDVVSARRIRKVISSVATERQLCSVVLTTHSMAEASALCDRLCIMVSGRIMCLGSPQHLKHRFGKGYTLEVRAKNITDDVVDAAVRRVKETDSSFGDRIRRPSLDAVFRALGRNPARAQEIHPGGTGWALDAELQSDRGVSLRDVVSWIETEEQNDQLVLYIMNTAFPPTREGKSTSLLERYSAKFRFSIPPQHVGFGVLFERLEEAKRHVAIEEYSIEQTTLDQIFSDFAALQEEEEQLASTLARATSAADFGAGRTTSEVEMK